MMASGPSSNDHEKIAWNKAEAKARKQWFKNSKMIRQYKKDLKHADAPTEKEVHVALGEKRSRADDESLKAAPKGKRASVDPFAKEKQIAAVAREKKEAVEKERFQNEEDKKRKLQKRKQTYKKLAERDSRGRPLVRNSINAILAKLQGN